MLKIISPDSLRSDDYTLAGFGTRHTLSDTTSNTRGIGAARRWLRSRFESFARNDPDFKVYEDRFVLSSVPLIPKPAVLVNVHAVLRGKEGVKGSYIVVSGHYDSMCTNIMNDTSDATGADDGSGVSLVLEAARAFTSTHFKPDANIIFICLAGEEECLKTITYSE
ncbi:MAG: M28 family peptidase [Bacteroidetes bacterium]|nr:M28 family peptidase [Bacteroidota bacterium]